MLPILVTCQSGTLVMLSSDIKSPVGHESTHKGLIGLREAFQYSRGDLSNVVVI